MKSIYNSILLENQNPNNIDLELLKICTDGTYTINDDGSIDVVGYVDLNQTNLTKIPFKFRHVSDGFRCSNNYLTSLEGAPITVGGIFDCGHNHLTSLEGAPNSVGGNFNCDHNNNLTSLNGAPITVNGDFYCHGIPNLPYSELFKIVDKVKGGIYYSSLSILEDKDKIREGRDVKNILKDDELGNLDV